MVSVTQNSHQHKPLMVQAPVRALDPDGVAVVSAGTVAFAIGAGVCWWQSAALAATGRLWYLGVALAGTVIGLLGLAFGLFRKARRRRREDDEPAGDVNPRSGDAGTGPQPAARRALAPSQPEQPLPTAPGRGSVEEPLIDADGVPDRE